MPEREFLIKPSKIYLSFLSLISLISFIIVLTLPTSKWLVLCLLIGVALYSAYLFYRFGLQKHAHSILKLRYQKDGRWLLQTKQESYLAELSGQSTVTQMVCVLCFKTMNSYRFLSCLVFLDSLNADQYRQLMVVLKTSERS